jgi:hypothetical protein
MAINLRYPVSLDPSLRSIADNETWFVSAYGLIRLAAVVTAFQLTVDDKQTHGAGYENECIFESLLVSRLLSFLIEGIYYAEGGAYPIHKSPHRKVHIVANRHLTLVVSFVETEHSDLAAPYLALL